MHDPKEPRAERRTSREAGQRAIGAQECFLRDVVGVGRASEQRSQVPRRALMTPDELFECVDIALYGRSDEVGVGLDRDAVHDYGPGGPSIETSVKRPHPSTIVDAPSRPAAVPIPKRCWPPDLRPPRTLNTARNRVHSGVPSI